MGRNLNSGVKETWILPETCKSHQNQQTRSAAQKLLRKWIWVFSIFNNILPTGK